MGLSSALQIGRTGLLASQTALEVTGNNLANIATPGYHRQSVVLSSARPNEVQRGIFLGQGVEVQKIVRNVNEALENRIRNSVADQSYSLAREEVLSQIEAIQNELSDIDLTTRLNNLFNAFSELANTPLDNSVRTVVVQEAQTLATYANNLRADLTTQRTQVDATLGDAVKSADDLLTRIAQINLEIVKTEAGAGGAHGLRDERDSLLAELSGFIDISTVEQTNGAVDVFVGSLPVVLGNTSRGIELRTQTVNNQPIVEVVIKDDKSLLQPTSGQIAALLDSRTQDVDNAINTLDNFAASLIFEVNRVHSQGQGPKPFTSITGATQVADPTLALNDPNAGLDFIPTHGSFQVHVTQKSTGQRISTVINIDLDGINPATDTTLNSLATTVGGVANINASVTTDGRLQISSVTNDFEITFSDDSSGTLAALGINTFFTGKDAFDIQVNSVVSQDPGRINTALGHVPGDNQTALAIAALRDQGVTTTNGVSLTEFWNKHIQDYAVRTAQTQQQLDADTIVRQNLEANQQAISGVNADEEAINLLIFQRAFQGSARFISVVDQLLETLMALV